MSVKLERIAIVGAGIGGIFTALALLKKGYQVTIFEKAGEQREVNSGLVIWPNGSRVLKQLDLLDKVLSAGVVLKQMKVANPSGKILNSAGLELYNTPCIGIERTVFFNVLKNQLPSGIISTKRFSGYQNTNNEVIAFLEDGGSAPYDFIIGADGLYSKIREQMIGDGRPNYKGYTMWQGEVSYTHQDIDPTALLEIMGSGKRFGIIPMHNGKLGWWATYNETLKSYQHMDGRKKKLVNMFRSFEGPYSQIIGATIEEEISKTPIYDREFIAKWHDGKVLMIGDAAHPMTPNKGQAACLMMEDAYLLAHLLSSSDNLESALAAFELERIPRTLAIANESLRHGQAGQNENKWFVMFRNYFIKSMSSKKIHQLHDEMFSYSIN